MSLDIQNLGVLDPFSNDTAIAVDGGPAKDLIHIRNQQRNGRKSVTTVQGLDKGLDLKKIVRALKKEFSCNGTVIDHDEFGSIIQLQGDKRQDVKEFLSREKICALDQMRIHGA
ncbi:putative translation initiation factor SUI1 [Cardiosporidium cionae]|uniref:Translation initiation factor SUI1 n=1 Tax=Cardiosporidium cionae TaxID=476202 RepID=A0ABQ7J935_9APIC|nr:putative translation initiation factor SUI1 [Cardiosporidium cionae]|eukprot:KAF8820471.1 putative translation initiation factor SUI1 [Cardiosporidium cionae]